MTSIFLDQHSDTHIFVLSALASLLLHGLLMIGLIYLPQSTTMKEESPTVQVTLLPAPENPQTPQARTSPKQPHTAIQKTSTPPMPKAQPNRLQRPTPPLQATLTPAPLKRPSPLAPPTPAKPILKDTRAAQAMKARNMMKVGVRKPNQQALSSLPAVNSRINSAHRVMPPIASSRKEHSTARSLPAPSMLAKPQTLTAPLPAHTESTMTRPAILSSSRPVYPRVARESGWEGTVIVRTLIDRNGIPSQVNIRKSCGHPVLDQAAQDAVRNWTFQPAKDGNIPITKWVDIPIKFDLNS